MTITYDMRGSRLNKMRLGRILKTRWGDVVEEDIAIQDHRGHHLRFDYRVGRIYVEYHDAKHFTKTEVLQDDGNKAYNVVERHNGILITIPYFISLNDETWKYFFGSSMSFENAPKSGFVEKDVMPCDYNSYGEDRFMSYYRDAPPMVQTEILDSLARIQRNVDWSIFGQTLVYKELHRPSALRNLYL
jgi:hypothetical protein